MHGHKQRGGLIEVLDINFNAFFVIMLFIGKMCSLLCSVIKGWKIFNSAILGERRLVRFKIKLKRVIGVALFRISVKIWQHLGFSDGLRRRSFDYWCSLLSHFVERVRDWLQIDGHFVVGFFFLFNFDLICYFRHTKILLLFMWLVLIAVAEESVEVTRRGFGDRLFDAILARVFLLNLCYLSLRKRLDNVLCLTAIHRLSFHQAFRLGYLLYYLGLFLRPEHLPILKVHVVLVLQTSLKLKHQQMLLVRLFFLHRLLCALQPEAGLRTL